MIETYICPSCQKNIEWDDASCEEFIECPHCGDKLGSPHVPMLQKGTVIGDYVIKKRIGIGGMGEVYLAEQKSMMRPVALKVLQPDLVEDASYLERFRREVRILAKIEHPNIVNAIETGYEEGNICYFSMSYIHGKDLKHKLDTEGKMTELDALHVILNISNALKYVWEKHKLIHRDIKPANIILSEENEVKLMDLGISKEMADDRPADLTLAGMMVGSPYYISPEQARAEKDIDWRTDMYSLGASFYHMLVGDLPFNSENVMSIIAAHLSTPVPDPRKKNPEITDQSANIIGQMMQKKKKERFASWDEAIEAIEDAIEKVTVNGATTTISTSISKEMSDKLREEFKAHEVKVKTKQQATTKHIASPDIVEKVKLVATKTIFGNLYIRFVILVLLLFLTFISFFNVVGGIIEDAKKKKAAQRYIKAITFLKDKPDTKRKRIKAYNLLMDVKKAGNRKYSQLANAEIEKLRKSAFTQRNSQQDEMIKKELLKLKEESYTFEKNGKIGNALKVWRKYEMHGAFSIELKEDIQKAIDYLRRQRKSKPQRGIE